MKKIFITILLIIVLTNLSVAQDQIQEHWSPYKYPSSFPENAKIHIVVKGDSLWELAQTYYKNPLAWPQIHAANPYVSDPHWIYPGDPIALPDLNIIEPGVLREGQAGQDTTADRTGQTPGGESADKSEKSAIDPTLPPADFSGGVVFETEPRQTRKYEGALTEDDHYCSLSAFYEKVDDSLYIAGTEENNMIEISDASIVYISKGEGDLKPDDLLVACHYETEIKDPDSGEFLGHVYQELGLIKVLLVDSDFSVGEVIRSCDGLKIGNTLYPYILQPSPLYKLKDKIHVEDRYRYFDYQRAAKIIWTDYSHIEISSEDSIIITKGSEDGVRVGDMYTINQPSHFYRLKEHENVDDGDNNIQSYKNFGNSRKFVDWSKGEIIIYRVSPRLSVAKVKFTSSSIHLLDIVIPAIFYESFEGEEQLRQSRESDSN